ncbi:MAG: Nramp family divalent metal transporter [Candidatus Cyclobacteriaceae bacterium M2_1C_046]
MLQKLKSIGPAVLVTSAFIGPGTVTICSIAGNRFGYTLLWALIFSIIATIVLQEMCARLGVISQQGLGKSIRDLITNKTVNILVSILIFSAIIVGNGAYEAGNISGAALGMVAIFIGIEPSLIILSIGLIAAIILFSGSYKVVEKMMIILVVVMSVVFLVTAIYVKPDLSAMLKGSFIPTFPEGSTLIIVGLIGTTVVPYNLFLHTSSAATKWKKESEIPEARFDTIVSIIIGGLISLAIIVTSAAAMGTGTLSSAADLAIQLEPLLGTWAGTFISIGLFAAGISSAITAPLAAGYAASGIFGFKPELKRIEFRMVSGLILVIGLIFSISGLKPVEVIQFAQIANGILLPFVAIFLVWIMNNKPLLGEFVNSKLQNIFGILVIIITIILGVKSIFSATGIL